MKLVLNLFVCSVLLNSTGFSFEKSFSYETIGDSSEGIFCVFYLEEESELMQNVSVFVDSINLSLTTNIKGEILLPNIKEGCYNLNCIINNTVIFIDNVLLSPPKTNIRLYDYMFEPHKQLIDWALEDIKSKSIKILIAGLPSLYKGKTEVEKRKTDFENKYNIIFNYHSCDLNDNHWLYNYKIFNYLDNLYGDDWRKDYDNIWASN